MQGVDENGDKVTDNDLISPAEFLLLLSSPDIDPETDVEAMERLAHIMESMGEHLASRGLALLLMLAQCATRGSVEARSGLHASCMALASQTQVLSLIHTVSGVHSKQQFACSE